MLTAERGQQRQQQWAAFVREALLPAAASDAQQEAEQAAAVASAALLRCCWRIPWDNKVKEVLWWLALDGLPLVAWMPSSDLQPCGCGCRPASTTPGPARLPRQSVVASVRAQLPLGCTEGLGWVLCVWCCRGGRCGGWAQHYTPFRACSQCALPAHMTPRPRGWQRMNEWMNEGKTRGWLRWDKGCSVARRAGPIISFTVRPGTALPACLTCLAPLPSPGHSVGLARWWVRCVAGGSLVNGCLSLACLPVLAAHSRCGRLLLLLPQGWPLPPTKGTPPPFGAHAGALLLPPSGCAGGLPRLAIGCSCVCGPLSSTV